MAQSIEQLSFELTANALAEQERVLAGLRARAGTVLAAASIAGSFLANKTGHGSLGVWGVLAMISFVLCVSTAIWVLLAHELVFTFRGQTLFTGRSDRQRSWNVNEAYAAAGAWIRPHLETNRNRLAGLSGWLAVSCALLAAEIILWTISIIG
jgi:hypothetical protein